MLQSVSLPVCEIGGMKSTHIKLLSVLLSFSDRNGKCWPSLRTIAERAKESLSWVQRGLREMESLRYFKRARRLRSYVYHLAERFLPRFARPMSKSGESYQRDSVDKRGNPATCLRNPQGYAQSRVPSAGQKENPDNVSIDSNYEGGDGRSAPLTENDRAHVDDCVAEATAVLRGKRVHDPEAYEAAKTENRFKQWLRGRAGQNDGGLYRFVCDSFSGQQLWAAQEAISTALEAGSREATPKGTLSILNKLDKLYREKMATSRAAWDEAKQRARGESHTFMRKRGWGHYR